MKEKTFYLAHNLENREKIRKWQIKMEGKYNIKFTNPFYNFYRKEINDLDSMKTKKERFLYKQNMSKFVCKHIVKMDLDMIRKSDGIIAILPKPTIGTAQEIFFAGYVLQIPVYVVTSEYYTVHPWIRTFATKVFTSKRKLQYFLKESLGEKK